MRRRIEAGPEERDFPVLDEFFAVGATDYLAQLFVYGERRPLAGNGIVYSFRLTGDGGFSDDDTALVQATLPALSLAMKAHAGHVIASGLLGRISARSGRRVHAGAIKRGSVDDMRRGDLVRRHRGFTAD